MSAWRQKAITCRWRPVAARKGHWTSKFKRSTDEDRTSPDGIKHDSVGEMKRWCKLSLLQREGFITELERQIKMPLILPNGVPITTRKGISKKTGKPIGGRTIVFTLDFRYRNADGVVVNEEYKGFMAEDAALKLSVVEAIYGIDITIKR